MPASGTPPSTPAPCRTSSLVASFVARLQPQPGDPTGLPGPATLIEAHGTSTPGRPLDGLAFAYCLTAVFPLASAGQ
jgi:hypothetical protein